MAQQLEPAAPFLRWVGGKARVVSKLEAFFLPIDPRSVYFEPFVGAGSVFFRRSPSRSVLGDRNDDLIACYGWVRDRPDLVWRHLRAVMQKQSRPEYLRIRDEFNHASSSSRKAALFIYLNKTSFNGIWRVSLTGNFNVPYGAKSRPGFPTLQQLVACSNLLKRAQLRAGDFETNLIGVKKGDHVFLDPPYVPLTTTAFFTHYTAGRFSTDDHERLAILATELAGRGVHVMITQGDSALVRKWYRDFSVVELGVRRFVSSTSEKVVARELVITSYPIRSAD
jgi:DNA adenine methylase